MKTTILALSLLFSATAFSQTVGLEFFTAGITSPVEITHAGDDRLFVVQQDGAVKIVSPEGSVSLTPFLNIASKISFEGERGLLGLAFHPDYATNGYFFVDYTNTDGDTVIARYQKSGNDENIADEDSETILLTIPQPFANHNGGCLRFGPDGYLYVSMGDGGSGGDPDNNAQNINSLLGKMLRLDVDTESPYVSPSTNRYIGVDGADEIWSVGLRNAWKFSFNRLNGDMWIADVGQDEVEEINKVTADDAGYNFGWRCYEGTEVYDADGCAGADAYTMPYAEYTHAATEGCSITGGYAYTGENYPAFAGWYFFADYCNNKIGIVGSTGDITYTEAYPGNDFTTFGEDVNGELYIAGTSSGTIFKIIDEDVSATKKFAATGFNLYPNPAQDEVFLDTQTAGISAMATIYTIDGKQLLQQPLNSPSNRIDTSLLASGIYMLEVNASGNKNYQKLVIK